MFADALSTQDIAERAYLLYLKRGAVDGHDLEDWLEAERECLLDQSQVLAEQLRRDEDRVAAVV